MQKTDRNSRTKTKAVAGFHERMSSAAAAKSALLETFRANKIDINDPAFQEQQAARRVAAEARAARDAQRKADKLAAQAQAIADQKAAQAAALAEAARSAEEAEAARIAKLATDKAARDARYAARKAKK